ncbi:endonuclease/exonuclease/phosphatase family protein [Porphyrobacter sp. YT40]|uniref:endonuclease/exonuclease/phosphatase family protein n=1 Tax=Porphyrobacter sp. YT40 TaxID=2547601 RepID=UPI001144FBD7|nr:endonuclease/exonuclease/phosphatase family protein [Porphyrobacter sp. YT40]QDH35792.1 endonuclease [Porphyrobacter sp. YT40]
MNIHPKLRLGLTAVTLVVAALALLVSGLSTIESNEWWIRIWDFPRLQILTVIVVAAIALGLLQGRRFSWIIAPLLVAGGWQFYRIMPYTMLQSPEVALADASLPDETCFSFVSLNVLQYNRDYGRTSRLLKREDPDIVLLLETDAAWQTALEPVLSRYPSRLDRPLDNTYGLLFATRLPMASGTIEDIAEPDTPSIMAQLATKHPFVLMGLHPRPPHPGQDTEERDAEILIAARRAARLDMPVIAIGDFNDVAWSNTSQTFKRIGGYLDPRIGRGTFATFPADLPWLAWPLDHVFMTEEFTLRDIRVLEDVGSDHRPVSARICLTPRAGAWRNDRPDTVTAEDRETAAEVMEEYREDQAEEARGED